MRSKKIPGQVSNKRYPEDITKPNLAHSLETVYFLDISSLTFRACFKIPIIFSNLNSTCYNLLAVKILQEQVKKAFCYQELF